jgi:hypothetical protein
MFETAIEIGMIIEAMENPRTNERLVIQTTE